MAKTLRVGMLDANSERFVIWWIDSVTGDKTGPDGGNDYAGYTDDGLRKRLNEIGLKPRDIDECVRQAKALRDARQG
jgi:hypothetical protein